MISVCWEHVSSKKDVSSLGRIVTMVYFALSTIVIRELENAHIQTLHVTTTMVVQSTIVMRIWTSAFTLKRTAATTIRAQLTHACHPPAYADMFLSTVMTEMPVLLARATGLLANAFTRTSATTAKTAIRA
jgi:hypothetical protein